MRKTIAPIIKAFLDKQPKKGTNTVSTGNELLLYGNKIAYWNDKNLIISNCGYFTATTKYRLNCLPNVRIQQKQGAWYLNNEFWNGKEIEIKL